jgi:thiamine-phosphate pyrophosphorylase
VVARLSGAAGVHVGQDDLPAQAARAQLGPAAIVGVSTHTIEQIDVAVREPVSYIAVGPVFGTVTKQTGYEAVGLDLVQKAAARSHLPVVAIGGITLEQAAAVIEAGAAAVAVIGDLLAGNDPRQRVAAYRRVLRA